jgi:alkylation response protein AidB-like acyl-CoA dehydrogenase
LLGHERTDIARVGRSKAALKRLKLIAHQELANDRPLIEDYRFRDKIALIELELMALEITNLRVLTADGRHHAPGPEASILKIKGSEIEQMLTELMMLALGRYSLPLTFTSINIGKSGRCPDAGYAASLSSNYFNSRKVSIYGGSNEIQKNIIAQMILGL